MSITQFMKSDYTPPEIIVSNLVQQESVSVISGCSGIGKSWMALNIGLSIAGGRPLFGFFEVPKKRKVLLAQFELTNGQVKERFEILQNHYSADEWKTIGNNFDYIILDEDNPSFTDRWTSIDNLLDGGKYDGGVVIVDNLYTSIDSSKDTSTNADLIPIVARFDAICRKHNVTIIIITHHRKGVKCSPIEIDDILGGATLTRWASNVFQIKNSRLSNDLRVAMITKVRGEDSQLVEVPFKLRFDEGWFEKGEIIPNEILHYVEAKERWEIKLMADMKSYESIRKTDVWTRADIWQFLSGEQGWEQTPSNETKVTRLISKCVSWGLMSKEGHNEYKITKTELTDD